MPTPNMAEALSRVEVLEQAVLRSYYQYDHRGVARCAFCSARVYPAETASDEIHGPECIVPSIQVSHE
jgi:hypothetical protein